MFLLIVKKKNPSTVCPEEVPGILEIQEFWESSKVVGSLSQTLQYLSLQPIQIINSTIEMVKPGKLPSGKTEIPFEFPLQMKGNKVLYETYHGVFVNIQVRRSCLQEKREFSSAQCLLKQLFIHGN